MLPLFVEPLASDEEPDAFVELLFFEAFFADFFFAPVPLVEPAVSLAADDPEPIVSLEPDVPEEPPMSLEPDEPAAVEDLLDFADDFLWCLWCFAVLLVPVLPVVAPEVSAPEPEVDPCMLLPCWPCVSCVVAEP